MWPTPNGLKISIALREMGLPYTLIPVNIGVGDQFRPEFLALSPNGRMPAIVDFDTDDGRPQWLFWQVGGLGPMAGQANHFRAYAPTFLPDQRQVAYGANRYTNEVHRLWGVVEGRLKDRDFLAGDYSIADMASWPWMRNPAGHGVDPDEFPRAKAWSAAIAARPAAIEAVKEGEALRAANVLTAGGAAADKARALLFGQRARK